MALVSCKECSEKVSTDANNCTKCGAKVPKKTSTLTWLVLIFIVSVVYFATQSPTSTSSRLSAKPALSPSSEVTKIVSVKKTPPPMPAWTTATSKDEMTGKLSAFASSPSTISTKTMSFPYGDVRAWMGIGCNGESEWVYMGFSSSPNLAKTETEDGYSLIETRIKWDSEIHKVTLRQDWGADAIHFSDRVYDDGYIIKKISTSNSALLELQWHGQQATYFDFSLNGSSKAVAEIRNKCASAQNK
jgi:hypothetical protein